MPPAISMARPSMAAFTASETVFELKPRQGGGWTERLLYSFNFNGTDGATPALGWLISDNAGNATARPV